MINNDILYFFIFFYIFLYILFSLFIYEDNIFSFNFNNNFIYDNPFLKINKYKNKKKLIFIKKITNIRRYY